MSMASIAGSRAVYRPVGVSFISRPGALPASRVSYSGPRVSQNNPIAVQGFRNFDTMANNRLFTKGFAQPTAQGYSEAHNNMRNLVHIGEGYRGSVRDAMNAQANAPTKVIYKTRPGTSFTAGGFNPASGQAVNQNAWRSQQNSAGLGRNRGYSNGMSQFAINNSANSGLNRMR